MANTPPGITNGNGTTTTNGDAAAKVKKQDTAADFKGDVKVNNNPPTKEQLEKIADLTVLDADDKPHTFKSLYADNENGKRKVLVIFIRHFFCGNCQEYIRTLSTSIPPSSLSSLPTPTSIVVIGCGQPELIPTYVSFTSCPYPIYADPNRKLYDALGMTKTLNLGSQPPEYQQKSIFVLALQSFFQELRSGRQMLRGGDFRQVGGEFLFEAGKVGWCRRMRNTRDHAEIYQVREKLGLDGEKKKLDGEEKKVEAEGGIMNGTETASGTTDRPGGRKRWSATNLGAGLGRRLSNRRQSWAGSRSRSRNTEKTGSPARSGMEGVKEEETNVKTSEEDTSDTITPSDALAKLEGKADRHDQATNGVITENEKPQHDAPKITEPANSAVIEDNDTNHGMPITEEHTNTVANGAL